jgi:hypothetical protein
MNLKSYRKDVTVVEARLLNHVLGVPGSDLSRYSDLLEINFPCVPLLTPSNFWYIKSINKRLLPSKNVSSHDQ